MKNFIICMLLFCITLIFSGYDYIEDEPKKKTPFGKCPVTQTVGDIEGCLMCHQAKTFKVNPTINSKILLDDNKEKYGYYVLTDIDDIEVKNFFDYIITNKIKKVTIESNGPGGSLLAAWRIIGIINNAKSNNIQVDTKVLGYALSANFIVFMAGDKRIVSPYAEMMYHEVRMKDYKEQTPSSAKEDADVLIHLQESVDEYISNKCDMTKEELKAKIKNKEYWLNGREAKKLNFATHILRD
jgi:ATP-dependent protease ClpP protease subunit